MFLLSVVHLCCCRQNSIIQYETERGKLYIHLNINSGYPYLYSISYKVKYTFSLQLYEYLMKHNDIFRRNFTN